MIVDVVRLTIRMAWCGTTFKYDRCITSFADTNMITIIDMNICSCSAHLCNDTFTSRQQFLQLTTSGDMISMNMCVYYKFEK